MIYKQGYPSPNRYKVLARCLTYNQSKYVEETLHGFVIQKTNFDFVVFVIDDCSTDGEQAVLKHWVENRCASESLEVYDNEVAVIYFGRDLENEHCIYAIHLLKRNLYCKPEKDELIKYWRVQCDYEAMCEGDDYWIDSNKIQKQADYLDSHPDCSGTATQAKVIYDNGSPSHLFNKLNQNTRWCKGELVGFRQFHTASLMFRHDSRIDDKPAVFSGDILYMGALSIIGYVNFDPTVSCVYRKQPIGASSTASIEQLRKDFNMIPYFKKLDQKFNIGRAHAYLNYAFAFNPIEEGYFTRLKYGVKAVVWSFTYFPHNGKILLKTAIKFVMHTKKALRIK